MAVAQTATATAERFALICLLLLGLAGLTNSLRVGKKSIRGSRQPVQTATEEPRAKASGNAQQPPPLKKGVVSAMWTFGAPASHTPAFWNPLQENGCFEGLRSYSEDVTEAADGKLLSVRNSHEVPERKTTDMAPMSNSYEHAKMGVVVLRNTGDSRYVPCPGQPTWPSQDGGELQVSFTLHFQDGPRLQALQIDGQPASAREPFQSAFLFSSLAYAAYASMDNAKKIFASQLSSWNLVAKETRIQGAGVMYDEDPVLLAQSTKNLECTLVFTGVNNLENEVFTIADSTQTEYCGFAQVHRAFASELTNVTADLWPLLRPKLKKCSRVHCVGHSMGGSMCELLAGCANSGRAEQADFQRQSWEEGTPELIEPLASAAGGVVYAPGAEKRCATPPC